LPLRGMTGNSKEEGGASLGHTYTSPRNKTRGMREKRGKDAANGCMKGIPKKVPNQFRGEGGGGTEDQIYFMRRGTRDQKDKKQEWRQKKKVDTREKGGV